jgi:hypothetical protein
MNTDLQDIIAESTKRAFNAGYNAGLEAGKTHVLNAVKFVQFEYKGLEVAAISDLQEELADRATLEQGYISELK